jgi:Beta-lactamase inhibitor (BLIP)
MKNLYNLGLVVLLLVVLGCNCQQKLQEIADKSKETPSSSPNVSNTSSSPKTTTPTKNGKASLSLDKYNQIKNGMSYKDIVNIIGSEGVETMSSGDGKYKVTSYKWEGEGDFEFIYAVFTGDKMSSKTQANLK